MWQVRENVAELSVAHAITLSHTQECPPRHALHLGATLYPSQGLKGDTEAETGSEKYFTS